MQIPGEGYSYELRGRRRNARLFVSGRRTLRAGGSLL